MTQDQFRAMLQPGDGITYTGSTLFDEIEKIKLGSDATHSEVYIGHGLVVTSLAGPGVGIYNVCEDQIIQIERPIKPFNCEHAVEAFKKCLNGLPYGFDGLLNFTDENVASVGMFCSQVKTCFFRSDGLEPFNKFVSHMKVAPRDYLYVSSEVFQLFR
jgi:hypothetical protein